MAKAKASTRLYPPEASIDLTAKYPTPEGSIGWVAHHTDDEYGHVDLNTAIGKHMGALAYVLAEFQSDPGQDPFDPAGNGKCQ